MYVLHKLRKPSLVKTALTNDTVSDFSRCAEAFALLAERVLDEGAAPQIVSTDIERMLTVAMKLYAAKAADIEGTPPPPVSADQITATDVVTVVSEAMRAMNLNLFDLSMWYRR
jgi:hypothetical protein